MRKLTYQNMVDIVNGAGLFGAGGGGSIVSGLQLAKELRDEGLEPVLITMDEVENDKTLATVAGMGAPVALLEKKFNVEGIKALELLEKTTGKTMDYLIPVETGAFNTLVPIYVGAKKGLPVVDADGAGRAVPQLEMLMFSFYDIPPSPFAISDKTTNSAVVYTANSYDCENLARHVVMALEMSAGIASYVMDGAMCKKAMIPSAMTIAEKAGRVVREAKEKGEDFIKPLLTEFGGYHLITGKIKKMTTETKEGFDFGRFVIEGTGENAGDTLVVDYKNENMTAKRNGDLVAMVPDLICTISTDAQPLTNADLKEGMEIAVLGFQCDPKWKETGRPEVFKHVLEMLDYTGPYKPIEKLNK